MCRTPRGASGGSGMCPASDTLCSEGFRENTPQKWAGMRSDPPMSLPISRGDRPAATEAAPPPVLPPGVQAVFQGLFARPNSGLSVWKSRASMGMLVLPRRIAPAPRRRATAVASCRGIWSARGLKLLVVRRPAVSNASLTVTGTPCKGPHTSSRASASSASRARWRASGSLGVTMAFRAGLCLAICCRWSSRTSTAVAVFSRMICANSVAVRKTNSLMVGLLSSPFLP